MDRKIRIALLVPWLKSKGGVERAVLRLMHDRKYDIDLYTLNYDAKNTFAEFSDMGVHVIGSADTKGFMRKGASLSLGLLTSKIRNLEDYDIFMISTAGIAELSVFRNRHPLTVALTHTPLRVAHSMYDYYRADSLKFRLLLPLAAPVYRFLERRAWRRISYAIVFSEEVKRRLVDYKLIGASRVFKIGPHADYSKKGRTSTEKIIFYASRFTPYKRQDLAIEGFMASKLRSEGFKLVLGGFVENEKYFERIKEMVSGHDNIEVKRDLGEKELKDLYRKCYATLFMAVNEDTGLVPLESLAYGKPVISVDEGGPKEFITNGRNGMLVDATEEAVAGALNRLLDRKYYAKLRRNALKSKVYDEKRMMRNFDAAISKIMRGRKRNGK